MPKLSVNFGLVHARKETVVLTSTQPDKHCDGSEKGVHDHKITTGSRKAESDVTEAQIFEGIGRGQANMTEAAELQEHFRCHEERSRVLM